MKFLIAGITPNSFVDMKGKITYMVYTGGCNMNCWYCHNRHILGGEPIDIMPVDEVLADIKGRIGFIDAVCVSGGEPTLQQDITNFIREIKNYGLLVKLDTNGTKPEVVKSLIENKLIDYISMDIKAPLSKYKMIDMVDTDTDNIKKSIDIIMNSGIEYEFRTTYSPDLNINDIKEIAQLIEGAKLYTLQQFQKNDTLLKAVIAPHSREYILKTAELANTYVHTEIRGLGA